MGKTPQDDTPGSILLGPEYDELLDLLQDQVEEVLDDPWSLLAATRDAKAAENWFLAYQLGSRLGMNGLFHRRP